ncbi:hypothetical protein LOAG_10807 [Loa loa]|uniref:Uncharacterized protein n=1 Tax=Loa loa TaxID=7209 RepID=A0A1S0TP71_LOALO|nr:hypothetical protein LOAG_10807 [Loa loa]EFO17692.1 hypothetical protein LOAG_10807 [Loa loa]
MEPVYKPTAIRVPLVHATPLEAENLLDNGRYPSMTDVNSLGKLTAIRKQCQAGRERRRKFLIVHMDGQHCPIIVKRKRDTEWDKKEWNTVISFVKPDNSSLLMREGKNKVNKYRSYTDISQKFSVYERLPR